MIVGKVTGSIWATRKDERLNGLKLMTVEIFQQEKLFSGSIVAADIVGAGKGDTVLVTTGSSARFALSLTVDAIPIDAAIVGIIDALEK